jgi:hypothetical protein
MTTRLDNLSSKTFDKTIKINSQNSTATRFYNNFKSVMDYKELIEKEKK